MSWSHKIAICTSLFQRRLLWARLQPCVVAWRGFGTAFSGGPRIFRKNSTENYTEKNVGWCIFFIILWHQCHLAYDAPEPAAADQSNTLLFVFVSCSYSLKTCLVYYSYYYEVLYLMLLYRYSQDQKSTIEVNWTSKTKFRWLLALIVPLCLRTVKEFKLGRNHLKHTGCLKEVRLCHSLYVCIIHIHWCSILIRNTRREGLYSVNV